MANSNLAQAKAAKNDEFYTQFHDIEREVNAYLELNPCVFCDKTILLPCDDPYESNFFRYFAMNFNAFGLKKLIATCYEGSSIANTQLSLFDYESTENKTTRVPHKIEITEVTDENGIKTDNPWPENVIRLLRSRENALTRLQSNGDFRSDEIKKLRDEADIIITNPPFSLFREFLAWIVEADKQFLVLSNMNAITYKEVFPLIKGNKIWLGVSAGAKIYLKPDKTEQKMGNTIWFTNLDHGRRHQKLSLMTVAKNLKFSNTKKLEVRKLMIATITMTL